MVKPKTFKPKLLDEPKDIPSPEFFFLYLCFFKPKLSLNRSKTADPLRFSLTVLYCTNNPLSSSRLLTYQEIMKFWSQSEITFYDNQPEQSTICLDLYFPILLVVFKLLLLPSAHHLSMNNCNS